GDRIEWRHAGEIPVMFVARECRAADLVIAASNHDDVPGDPRWRLDPSDLVMKAGRPMLLVPGKVETLAAETVIVAWKDTREARRAVTDALPMLHEAKRIVVATVEESERAPDAGDVVAWLGRHGIKAQTRHLPREREVAAQLDALASEEGADL